MPDRRKIEEAIQQLGQQAVEFAMSNGTLIHESSIDGNPPPFLAHRLLHWFSILETPSLLPVNVQVKNHKAVLHLGVGIDPETGNTTTVAVLHDRYSPNVNKRLESRDSITGEIKIL